MAAQPPGQPQYVPDEHKPIHKSRALQMAIITAIFGIISAVVIWAVTRPDPPAGPSSDGASIIVEPAGPTLITVSGSGWKGDTAVAVRWPFSRTTYNSIDVLVSSDGTFTKEFIAVGITETDEDYTVTVTGRQSGHEVTTST